MRRAPTALPVVETRTARSLMRIFKGLEPAARNKNTFGAKSWHRYAIFEAKARSSVTTSPTRTTSPAGAGTSICRPSRPWSTALPSASASAPAASRAARSPRAKAAGHSTHPAENKQPTETPSLTGRGFVVPGTGLDSSAQWPFAGAVASGSSHGNASASSPAAPTQPAQT